MCHCGDCCTHLLSRGLQPGWLLGWSPYSTIVPEKPLHRDQLRALQRAQEAKAAAEPFKEARVKLQPRLRAPPRALPLPGPDARPPKPPRLQVESGTPLPPTSADGLPRKGPARFRRGQLPSPPTTRWMEHHQLRAAPELGQSLDQNHGRRTLSTWRQLRNRRLHRPPMTSPRRMYCHNRTMPRRM